ncbi:peptide ABC transporter ATPase, partial [Rothia sp. HMSC065C03]
MRQNIKNISLIIIGINIVCSSIAPALGSDSTKECSSENSAKVCQTTKNTKYKDKSGGNRNTGHTSENINDGNYPSQSSNSEPSTYTTKGANGMTVIRSKSNSNILGCVGKGGKIGNVKLNNLIVRDDGTYIDGGFGKYSRTSETCVPEDTRTLTSADSPGPTGPTYEEVMEEIRHAAESLEPGKPTLHQSYNNPAGTGRAEGDPNVYKGDQINFYVDDGGPYRLEADMLAGHVEIELMPSSYVIEYGNGDTATNYTAGKPVTTYPRERPRQTDTSYAYQRSGNFHAYATVHYTARFRVDGGPWQMMEVTPQATSDPLLVRVWWVDVGRVAGDCSYDDTRWGCKNDPTMGKKDNPNP